MPGRPTQEFIVKPCAAPGVPKPVDPVVYIVDDEPAITQSLVALFASVGLAAKAFHSVQAFRENDRDDRPACLLLDVRLRDGNGLDLQQLLQSDGDALPVIIMTGHGDIPMTVRAMKAGALDVLTKPFNDQDLLDCTRLALQRDDERRANEQAMQGLVQRYQSLSQRERQVMEHATAGLMNKQIADRLGISDITVKIHRGNAMRKMQARSFAQLVTMAGQIDARG